MNVYEGIAIFLFTCFSYFNNNHWFCNFENFRPLAASFSHCTIPRPKQDFYFSSFLTRNRFTGNELMYSGHIGSVLLTHARTHTRAWLLYSCIHLSPFVDFLITAAWNNHRLLPNFPVDAVCPTLAAPSWNTWRIYSNQIAHTSSQARSFIQDPSAVASI